MISKKEKEAKKLQLLEAEVLKRLRDTHLKQQEAIEEIQNIFKHHNTTREIMPGVAYDSSIQMTG